MPKRQIFYSFHFGNDCWRTQIVRNIGAIEGNTPVSSNAWEEVMRQGQDAIKRWIDTNMKNRSCVVVLVGSETAQRPWVQYEIEHAWKEGKGITCIDIHYLKDSNGCISAAGRNPLSLFQIDKTYNFIAKRDYTVDGNEICLDKVCEFYKPSSYNTYKDIEEHIEGLIEEAIRIRNQYPK